MTFLDQITKLFSPSSQLDKADVQPAPIPSPDIDTLALVEAANQGDIATVQALLDRNIDPNIPDHSGYNALHFAAMSGNEKLLLLLLDSGAKVETRTVGSGLTALTIAIASREKGAAYILMDRGAVTGPEELSDFGLEIYRKWLAERAAASAAKE